eukprot:scaffold110321_cov72-Phaeocystis_antarctica.AAC.1
MSSTDTTLTRLTRPPLRPALRRRVWRRGELGHGGAALRQLDPNPNPNQVALQYEKQALPAGTPEATVLKYRDGDGSR